jgi:hypothetical protein
MPDAVIHIRADAGSGYALGFGDDPDDFPKPEGFPQHYVAVIEELSWYDEELEDDVIVVVKRADIEVQVTRHTRPTALSGGAPWYEVTFSGTLCAHLESDEALEAFLSHTADSRVDYALYFESTNDEGEGEGEGDLYSDEGYAFLWNHSLMVSVSPSEGAMGGATG